MKVVANTRNAQGTSASRRLRHADKVPGIVYGGKGQPVTIELDHNPLFHALRKEKFHASILDMELDGNSERVLLRTYQMHPYKPQVLHIDFQRVSEDTPIHMRVPLHFVGQESSPAVKISATTKIAARITAAANSRTMNLVRAKSSLPSMSIWSSDATPVWPPQMGGSSLKGWGT